VELKPKKMMMMVMMGHACKWGKLLGGISGKGKERILRDEDQSTPHIYM
jgi:hypothetical protein